ncbi:MAG TPA: ABC transporter ATP-binding protein, partial [Nitrolancea sp.]|nr:ABC transporter ATP-binding protein [Nitrolancea sp.]
SLLISAPEVTAVRFDTEQDALIIEADDVRAVYRMVPRLARDRGIRLFEIAALDDSLASVFAYVTQR